MSKDQICRDFNRDLQAWKDQAVDPKNKGGKNLHPDELDQLIEIYKKYQIPVCEVSNNLTNGSDTYYSLNGSNTVDQHTLSHFHLYNYARYHNFSELTPTSLSQTFIHQMDFKYTPAPGCRSTDKGGDYVLKKENTEIRIRVKEAHLWESGTTHITVITEQDGYQKKLDETSLQSVLRKSGLQGLISGVKVMQYNSFEIPTQFDLDEWSKAFAFWAPSGPKEQAYIPEEKFNSEVFPKLKRKQKLRSATGEISGKLSSLYECHSIQQAEILFKELQEGFSAASQRFSQKEVETELESIQTKLPLSLEEACQKIIERLSCIGFAPAPEAIKSGLLDIAKKAGGNNEDKLVEAAFKSLLEAVQSHHSSAEEIDHVYQVLKGWKKTPQKGSKQYEDLMKALEEKKIRTQGELESTGSWMEAPLKQKLQKKVVEIDRLLGEMRK